MITYGKIDKDIIRNASDLDCVTTKVTLDDYDWMCYKLETRFPIEGETDIYVTFEYFGCANVAVTVSEMEKYSTTPLTTQSALVSSDFFFKYLRTFLLSHIMFYDSEFAFNGEEIAIQMYNEMLDVQYEPEKRQLRCK